MSGGCVAAAASETVGGPGPTFWVLPALVSTVTPIPYRDVIGRTKDALLTAFVTGELFVVLPILAEKSYNLAIQSFLLANGGRHDEGIAKALAAVELDPESFLPYWFLQLNYMVAGRTPKRSPPGKRRWLSPGDIHGRCSPWA